jgi:hypothetical protein
VRDERTELQQQRREGKDEMRLERTCRAARCANSPRYDATLGNIIYNNTVLILFYLRGVRENDSSCLFLLFFLNFNILILKKYFSP